MTYKLITEPKTIVQKICNECGKVIETFDSTHPLTQYLVFDLQVQNGKTDLQTLDFGLQPYHWCPINKDTPYCLIPAVSQLRELQKRYDYEEKQKHLKDSEEQIIKELDAQTTTIQNPLFPSTIRDEKTGRLRPIKKHALYKDPKTKLYTSKGRPSKTALDVINKNMKKEEEKKKENDKI